MLLKIEWKNQDFLEEIGESYCGKGGAVKGRFDNSKQHNKSILFKILFIYFITPCYINNSYY